MNNQIKVRTTRGTSDRFGNVQYLSTIIVFILAGGLIGAATYVSFIPVNTRTILKLGIVAVSMATWLALRQSERYQQYSQISLGFLAVSLGVLVAQYAGNLPMRLLGFSITTVKGIAMAKFGEALPIIVSILLLHFATGGDLNGLYLKAGNLKLGLIAGFIGIAVFVGFSALQAIGSGLKWEMVAAALPWILIFIFSNAFMEELWFRALFLKKLEPLVGVKTTLIITSFVFASVHISSTYVIDILLFMVALMVLALIWGWLMWKSNSIWGPVLIHAAGDVLVILGFLAA